MWTRVVGSSCRVMRYTACQLACQVYMVVCRSMLVFGNVGPMAHTVSRQRRTMGCSVGLHPVAGCFGNSLMILLWHCLSHAQHAHMSILCDLQCDPTHVLPLIAHSHALSAAAKQDEDSNVSARLLTSLEREILYASAGRWSTFQSSCPQLSHSAVHCLWGRSA